MSCFRKVSNAIVNALEQFFYRIGSVIGLHPILVIAGCLFFVLACIPGIAFYFYEETAAEKLWVPASSQAVKDKKWVDLYFPSKTRVESVIVEAENVLEPGAIRAMLAVDTEIKALTEDNKYTWESICARLGSECWSNSLLELWSFDEAIINSLSKQDILNTVNTVTISPVYLNDYNVSQVLADVTRDDTTGDITAARAASMLYVLKTNSTSRRLGKDEVADAWEKQFLEIMNEGHQQFTSLYYFAVRSFSDEGGGAITDDISLLGAGYILIIAYVSVVLGRFNMVQHRVYMSLAGVLCVGLAIAVSFGLCSYAQVPYGPVHSILPFLLLGIGIDDMFVIVQAWDTLGPHAQDLPVAKKIALTMKEAGVAITVTSLTDILAFGIGATTVLPALQSFCIYASVGILATFLLQGSLFVACLTLDQKRAAGDRDACCCCYVHQQYEPNKCSQKSILQAAFDRFLAPFILKTPVKVVVLVLTTAVLATGIYGVTELRQDFDPSWFLPTDSYAYKYFQANDKLYPADGYTTAVYLGDIDYYGDFGELEDLYEEVSQDEHTYSGTVDAWFIEFKQWMNTSSTAAATLGSANWPATESDFYALLQVYIFAPPRLGARFARRINFDSTGSNRILASSFSLKHTGMNDASSEIAAMDSLRSVTRQSGFENGECFPYSRFYTNFETNKIIQGELYRNLGLAFLCIFIMLLLLIANFLTCLLVTLAVVMAVVDVGGLMYFWGLSIDTVASVQLILALGLAVDYSAHIGHTFMTQTGTRDERIKKTLHRIGPAVFHGGFSTFLAFILLAGSTSYVFTTFFKVFFGVVVFGLFHGLIFLPVVLSWIGPAPYLSAEESAHAAGSLEKGEMQAMPEPNHVVEPPVKEQPMEIKTAVPDESQEPGYHNKGLQMDDEKETKGCADVDSGLTGDEKNVMTTVNM